ncbi:MAG: DUF5658 family protein [Haloferacaceae archaeon]
MTDTFAATFESLRRRQAELWLAALLLYGVGDGVTTVVGVRSAEVAEAGPIATTLLDGAGLYGFVALKFAFLAASFAVWWALDTPGRVAVPASLAVVGTVVTVWNVHVIVF